MNVEKQAYVVAISDELRADCDPEYANSPEYLARHPRPLPPSWPRRLYDARTRIPYHAARPVWLLGDAFENLGYVVANAVAWTLHINVRYAKEQSDHDD